MNIDFKKIIYILLCLFILIVFYQLTAQAYVDLNNFNVVNGGEWLLENDYSVLQRDKLTKDLYFLSNDDLINKIITGNIHVDSSTYDNDEIGLVFGYNNINDANLWTWDKGGVHGEGHLFYHKNQSYDYNTIPGELIYDGRQTGSGWAEGHIYNFKAIYLENKFELLLDGIKVIDVKGSFFPGKFGFFCFSQGKVTFSNIEIDSGEHLVKHSVEELDNPIYIINKRTGSEINSRELKYFSYDIINTSEYEIEDVYIDIELDEGIRVVEDSFKTSQENVTYNNFNNSFVLDNFILLPNNSLSISYLIQFDGKFDENKEYESKISVYSSQNNILVSNQINNKIYYNCDIKAPSAFVIGKLKINNVQNEQIFSKDEFKILSSDGRVIKLDKEGRYHLNINNFNNFLNEEIIVLKLKTPDKYKKYIEKNHLIKLIKIKPGDLVKQDFNINYRGKLDG